MEILQIHQVFSTNICLLTLFWFQCVESMRSALPRYTGNNSISGSVIPLPVLHRPVCACEDGYEGNPYDRCTKVMMMMMIMIIITLTLILQNIHPWVWELEHFNCWPVAKSHKTWISTSNNPDFRCPPELAWGSERNNYLDGLGIAEYQEQIEIFAGALSVILSIRLDAKRDKLNVTSVTSPGLSQSLTQWSWSWVINQLLSRQVDLLNKLNSHNIPVLESVSCIWRW